MAVSLLSGFPVVAGKAANATATLSTAAHSASGACKLVLCLTAEGNTGAITNTAITDSTGGTIGTWTRHVSKRWSGGSFNDFSWTEIWVADCSAAYTSKTVTLTVTGGGGMMAAMGLYAVTGFDASTPFGAEDNGASTSDASSHLIAGAVTATSTGGLIVGAGTNGNSSVTLVAQTGTTIDKQQDDGGVGTASVVFHKTAATSSGSAYTVGTTKSDQYWGYAIAEIKADTGTVTGTIASTLANATSSTAGTVGVTGTIASTLANATSAVAGSFSTLGSIAATLANATSATSGTVGVSGAIASTLANATSSVAGTVGVKGAVSSTLADASCSAAGTGGVKGSISATLADASCSASGTVGSAVSGAIAVTLADASCSMSGAVGVKGSVSATLGDATCDASGTVGENVTGTITVTLANAVCSMAGTVGDIAVGGWAESGATAAEVDGDIISAQLDTISTCAEVD